MERRRRTLWTRLVTLLAVLVLLAAGASLAFRFAVDAVPGYRGKVEAAVGAALGRPVRIGSMALVWLRLRPALEFRDLAVLDPVTKTPLLHLDTLRAGTGFGRLLSGEKLPSWVEIGGVRVEADVDRAGYLSIRGIDLDTSSAGPTPLAQLDRIDRIVLTDAQLVLRDARLGERAKLEPLLTVIDRAELRRSGAQYRLESALRPPPAVAASATLQAEIDGDAGKPETWNGQVRAHVDGVQPGPWLAARLPADVHLALDGGRANATAAIDGGRITRVVAQFAATALHAQRAGGSVARLDAIDIGATATPLPAGADGTTPGWTIQLPVAVTGRRGAWPQAASTVVLKRAGAEGHGATIDATLGFLRLDDLLPWVALFQPLPDLAARLQGDATAVHVQWAGAGDGSAAPPVIDAQLKGLTLLPQDGQPSFTATDARVHVEGHGGRVQLAGAAPTVALPQLFAEPVVLTALDLDLGWQREAAATRLLAPAFTVQLYGAQVKGQLDLSLPDIADTPPRMKLIASLAAEDAARLKGLMPLTWGEKTRDWLTRAIVKGHVPRGKLVIDGPLVPRNERYPDGTPWHLDLDVDDATLAFAPDWPAAEKLDAHLEFRDHGMTVTGVGAASVGVIDGVSAQKVEARIADFHDSDLLIDLATRGEAAGFYRLLRDSPLRAKLANLLEHTEASGPAAVAAHLDIGLHTEHTEVHASGTVDFGDEERGAQLVVRGLAQPIEDVRGRLAFAHDVSAEALTGTAFGTPLRASIRPRPGSDGESVDTLLAEFETDVQAADGPAATYVPAWLRESLAGRGAFHLTLPFSGVDSGRVTLTSDLRGVASTLPAPLGKNADEPLPLSVRIGGPPALADGLRIIVAARGDALRATLRLAKGEDGEEHTRGVQLRFGPGETPLADADGVVVDGRVPLLDARAWGALGKGLGKHGGGATPLAFRRADVRVDRLVLGHTGVDGVHVLAVPGEDGVHVTLDGDAATGSVDWARADAGAVRARLTKLALEAVQSPPPTAKALVDAAEQRDAEAPRDSFDPTEAPTLDIEVQALSIGGVDLGRLQLQTRRTEDGQSLRAFTLAGGRVDARVQGDWRRSAGHSAAHTEASLEGRDVGPLLDALGYSHSLAADRATVELTLDWPQQPDGLALSQARGAVSMNFAKGQLKAVEPGAPGRVLGLLNLYALPRRLLLDFRDVAGQGLAFDTLRGHFTLADGQARTDDLDITSPSVKIALRGRIGLAARDFDQRVTVRPDISTGVTVGATLLGGPIAGGIALVVQQLAGKPLSALTQYSYRVTGSWDDPQIDKGNGETRPASGVTPAPAVTPKTADTRMPADTGADVDAPAPAPGSAPAAPAVGPPSSPGPEPGPDSVIPSAASPAPAADVPPPPTGESR